MSEISSRFREVRKALNLNQGDFAKTLHVSRSHLSNIESGKREPSEQTCYLLCSEFHINEKWLISGEKPMFNQAEIDAISFAEAARGQNPSDIHGEHKADALNYAAILFHQFQSISYAGEIEELLTLLSVSPFSEQFAYILSLYSDVSALNDEKSLLTLKLFNTLFETTFDLSSTINKLKKRGASKEKSFSNDPLTRYLEAFYQSTMAEKTDTEDKGLLSVSGLAAAGVPLFSEADGETVLVPSKYLNPQKYFIVQAKGDSMTPDIPEGSYVVVEHEAEPAQGGLALVSIEGFGSDQEYTIKLIYYHPDTIELRSYNPECPPMVYPRAAVRSAERIVYTIKSA